MAIPPDILYRSCSTISICTYIKITIIFKLKFFHLLHNMFTAFYGNPQAANAYNHHPNRNPGSIPGEGKILHISVYMKLLQYFITQSNDCKNSNGKTSHKNSSSVSVFQSQRQHQCQTQYCTVKNSARTYQ